ncbi:uncharacterized protein LOC142180965 [Nicotiana tabacum]|uniref:Uncharacterized protein LOC142180965 n=1 Tax=Nicotiana tabacum TaxID=4097 RepID=A0AC58UI63_TOBAC
MGDTSVTPDASVTHIVAGNAVIFDTNHLYFLHSSDAPSMALVNTAFNGRGFQEWKRSVLIALSAKNKLGFINGSCPPPIVTSKDFQPWSRCNDMVTSWLLNSLSKDIRDSVIYSKSAKDLWTSLEHKFGQSNGAKLYHMRKELSGLVQGSSDMARGNILMMNSLPNINHVYSLVLQDENQREIYANPLISSESSSFMVGNQANLGGQSAFQQRNNNNKGPRNFGQFQKSNNNIQK